MNDYELLFNNDKNKEFNNIQIIRELGNGTKLKLHFEKWVIRFK